MNAVNVRTKRGATRRYGQLINGYRSRWADGGMFGFDWRTMAINEPRTYQEIQFLATVFDLLPSGEVRQRV